MRYVGVDLGKKAFTVCFVEPRQEGEEHRLARLPMTREGVASLRAQLRPDDHLAVEAGPNAYFFYDQVRPAVAEVVLVSPRQFAVIATSTRKTDREDARALARFLRLGCLPRVEVPDAATRELRQLFATREALVQMATQLRNMGHAALVRNGIGRGRGAFASPEGRRRLARLDGLSPSDRLVLELVLRQLDQLEGEILQLEREIIRRGRSLPGLTRLLQVRGLSLVGAIGILAEIGDIRRFASAKHLVGYAGLASAVRQSGATEHHGHITKQGRTRLRGFLVQAALSAVRDPSRTPLGDFYLRKQREKGSGKAICATARKLLALIYILLTKDLDYWFLEERLYQRKLRSLARAA